MGNVLLAGTSLFIFFPIVILGCSTTKNESYEMLESGLMGPGLGSEVAKAASVAANDNFFRVKRLSHAQELMG